jgi:hypothetical protein
VKIRKKQRSTYDDRLTQFRIQTIRLLFCRFLDDLCKGFSKVVLYIIRKDQLFRKYVLKYLRLRTIFNKLNISERPVQFGLSLFFILQEKKPNLILIDFVMSWCFEKKRQAYNLLISISFTFKIRVFYVHYKFADLLTKPPANYRGGKDTAHQQVNCILFSVVFTPPPPSHHGSVWLLPVIGTTNAEVATVLGSIPASSYKVESDGGADETVLNKVLKKFKESSSVGCAAVANFPGLCV